MAIRIEHRQDMKLCRLRDETYLQILAKGGSIALYVRGMSMYPFIKDYDLLKLESLVGKSADIGDIVLVSQNGGRDCNFFIHRLVKIMNRDGIRQYYTKPDNSSRMWEGPFLKENINARVAGIERKRVVFDLQLPLVILINRLLALLSRSSPALLKIINYVYCLILERHLLFPKFMKHFRSKSPLYFNAQELFILLFNYPIDKDIKRKTIDLIAEGIHWQSFCDIALSSPKVYKILTGLRELCSFIEIPDFIIERLNNAYFKIIAETARYHRELLCILKDFSLRKISVMPLKGAYLSHYLHKDISARGISVDFDLLIKEEDIKKACDLMREWGYKEASETEIESYRWQKDFFKEGFYAVDLHWDITMMNRSKERIEGLWQDAKRAEIRNNGEAIIYYKWTNEALLVYLCVNLINSKGYRSLRYFFDIDALIRNSEGFDWDNLIDKAHKYKVNNSVYASLMKTKVMLGTKIPQYVLDRLRPSITKRLLIGIFLAKAVIFENCIRRKILDGFLSYIFFELLEAMTIKDYLKIIKRVLFPPVEALGNNYMNNMGISDKEKSRWQYAICIFKRFARSFNKIRSLFLK